MTWQSMSLFLLFRFDHVISWYNLQKWVYFFNHVSDSHMGNHLPKFGSSRLNGFAKIKRTNTQRNIQIYISHAAHRDVKGLVCSPWAGYPITAATVGAGKMKRGNHWLAEQTRNSTNSRKQKWVCIKSYADIFKNNIKIW